MGDGKDGGKFSGKERGTGDNRTDSRLTRDPPNRAADEVAQAQAIVDLRDKYRADVEGLIKLGERLQKQFKAAGKTLPLVRRTAAQELLRVYKALQDFESALPRGPGGILMQRTPFKPKPVPWPGRPRALSRIAPFSDANVKEWRAAAQEAGAPIPARTPKKYPTGPPKIIKKGDDSFFKLLLIKVPGMSLAQAAGLNVLMAKILRVLSHQALTEKEAAAIAPKLDLWKYLVLDYGDTPEHKIKVLEGFPVGHEYSVKLKNEFLAEAQKLSPKPLNTKQRITAPVNEWSREYRPDNSEDERAWYAALRCKGKQKDRASGYTPGEIVNKDGIVFVGPDIGESMFFAPDGRLYLVPQASLRDQQLEAFRIGVLNSAGGVILGWGVVVLGAAALAAPAAVAVASEALGATFLGSEVAGTATAATGLFDSVLYSRFAVWLGANWPVVLAEGSFYFGLGAFVYNFNPRQFVEDFKRDPVAALTDLAQQLASIAHDAGEARQAGLNMRPRGGTAAVPDDEPTPTVPVVRRAPVPVDDEPTVVARPVTTAPSPAPAANDSSSPTPNDVLKRNTADKLLGGKPANDNRLVNPAAQSDVAADDVPVPVVLKGTGTDGPVVDDSNTGVTSASRTRDSRSTGPTKGTVTPATGSSASGSGKGSGSGSGKGGGSGKGTGPGKGGGGEGSGDGDGPDDKTAKARATDKKPAAQNDNDRALGGGTRMAMGTRGTWKPVAPPAHPTYANRSAPLLQRLKFLAKTDSDLSKTQGARTLGIRQRTQLHDWIDGLEKGRINEVDILNPKAASAAAAAAKGAPAKGGTPKGAAPAPPKAPSKNRISVDSMENTIDSAISEEYRHQLALKTRMEVAGVSRSNNVGDQAADFQAQQAGRPRAFPFTTRTRDGQAVQFDDFDFNTGQPIESKSISSMVPPGTSPDEAIHEFRQQMTKQAYAARDNEVAKPVRWDVPPDVHQDVVDKAWGTLPKDVRDWIVVGPPTAPIRVTPTVPPPPLKPPPKKK